MQKRMLPKIAILGTGNVAFHLTQRLAQQNCVPVGIIARSAASGLTFLAQLQLDLRLIYETDHRQEHFDTVIIAVPDTGIEEVVCTHIFPKGSTVLHTSGALNMDLLAQASPHHGVLYPFQTFKKEKPVDFDQIPLLVEASDATTLARIKALAQMLGPRVREVNSTDRLKIHLAAVFACNFTNYLYGVAENILDETGFELKDLAHLMNETTEKALALGAAKAQTGPAIRKDQLVMQKHLQLLNNQPDLQELYSRISQQITHQLP